jgi:F-type H+-transporting ATPase subunit gamma
MATLRDVRNRISGVKKTQKITKAMKMVAAAKMRRAQLAVLSARPYAQRMKELLQILSAEVNESTSPLLVAREVRTVAVVVVTAERGMCGAFNANVIKGVQKRLADTYPLWNEEKRIRLYCIGKKGWDFFRRQPMEVAGNYPGIFHQLSFGSAQQVAGDLVQAFLGGEYDRVEMVYNEFKNVAQQVVTVEQLLPVPPFDPRGPGPTRRVEYLAEPSKERILEAMVPRHLNFQVWRILLESYAAEQGARMVAMENATENANEIINLLQLQYNKARQAAITKELLEIVSGAEALRSAD